MANDQRGPDVPDKVNTALVAISQLPASEARVASTTPAAVKAGQPVRPSDLANVDSVASIPKP